MLTLFARNLVGARASNLGVVSLLVFADSLTLAILYNKVGTIGTLVHGIESTLVFYENHFIVYSIIFWTHLSQSI